MSTRAVIAAYTNRELGQWRGTYHHFDGYPSGLGKALWQLYHEFYKGLLPAMIEMLIDAHPQGWSSIVNADWNLRPTWIEDRGEWYTADKQLPPLSYKYRPGEEHNEAYMDQTTDSWQEWAYVFDLERQTMTILERIASWETVNYRQVATLSLAESEPTWTDFE